MNKKEYYEIEAEEVDIFGNLREVAFAENILRYLPKKATNFIDVACGDGYLLYRVNEKIHCKYISGLDISFKRLQKTRKNISPTLFQGTVFSLPFKDGCFDTVVCSETLEHLLNYECAITELLRITGKNLILTVPNEENITRERCPRCDHRFYVNDHINSFSSQSLKKTIKKIDPYVTIVVRSFHTIYSYNNATLKWFTWMRIVLDQILIFFSSKIPFLKPNYLIISIKKVA